MELTMLPFIGVTFMCANALRCYHGANVALPGTSLKKATQVLECGPFASFCRRAYGLINGEQGWILSCMVNTSLGAEYCL
ncbi:unnamed protein product, partial [Anisakis simplex]